MIPVSIVIRLIQEFGVLPYISGVLEPVMGIVGLPAETAIVWLTGMVVNIYGGLLSLFSIYPSFSEPLTHAQLTILLTMILLAHTIPVEVGIAKKTGVKFWIMFLIRFLGAIAIGAILNGIYSLTGTLQETVTTTFLMPESLSIPMDPISSTQSTKRCGTSSPGSPGSGCSSTGCSAMSTA